MRWIAGVMLGALLLLGLVVLRPAQAARTLDCRPGARHSIEGIGPPRTALLLLFDGVAIGGGTTGADGAYRIPLVVGDERPGVYPVDVVRRDNRAVIDSATCVVPSPNAPASPRAVVTNAPAPTTALPPTASPSLNTPVAGPPTATRTPTVSPSPSATLRPGAPSPTITPTGSATPIPTPTATTTQASGIEFTLDDLDTSYAVTDDVDVTGSLLDGDGNGIINTAVTVTYTINGANAIGWCNATTDSDGDWECPTKTVPASWVGKTIRIIAVVTIQGRSYTATGDAEFTVTPEET
ncbi:MAG: hypothetical protein H7Y32_14705 [Chloroflexales bacterium]|nr:hypothetical protein [Chloroflexales bacterium]